MKSINDMNQRAMELQEQTLNKQKERFQQQKMLCFDYLRRLPRKQDILFSLTINAALLVFLLIVLMISSHQWVWSLLIIDLCSILVNLIIYRRR